jgi:hypothetical protein
MNAKPKSSLVEDLIATKSAGKNLDKASGKDVMLVYTDVLITIEQRLQTDAEDFPPNSVKSIKQALNAILLKFESFIKQGVDEDISKDINIVKPPLQRAIGAITSASNTLKPESVLDESDHLRYIDKTDKFTQSLLRCREQIGYINMQLIGYLESEDKGS